MDHTAVASGMSEFSFTPQHAALGGAILGVAVVGNLFLNGRVLGISGAIKGLVQGERQGWRAAFLLGCMLPVPFMAHLLSGAFHALPETVSVLRTIASGLLVGLGSALGNGCTSGHGICGNARLSPRSMAYTASFMVSGALTAWATNTAGALNIGPTAPSFAPISATHLRVGLSVLLLGAAALVLLAAAYLRWFAGHATASRVAQQVAHLAASALTGVIFACGLMLSGMTRPEKVIGFLSVTHPAFDPSLMFVMMAAIGVSIGPFQMLRGRVCKPVPALAAKPVLADSYCLPSNAARVDRRLLIGSLLFGAGWGISGMCPGPALVVAASPAATLAGVAYLVALVAGMALEPVLSRRVAMLRVAVQLAAVVKPAAGPGAAEGTTASGKAASAVGASGGRTTRLGGSGAQQGSAGPMASLVR